MVTRLSVVRYPRARALAAWTSEFMASSRELDIRLRNHPRMPFQWSSTVLAKRFERFESAEQGCVAPAFEVTAPRPGHKSFPGAQQAQGAMGCARHGARIGVLFSSLIPETLNRLP